MSDDPDKDYTPPPPPRPIGMTQRRSPSGPMWAGLPVWAWASLGVLLLAGLVYVAIMIALGVGNEEIPEAATPPTGSGRPADLFVAGFYDALSYHDYVYASTLVSAPLAAQYDPAALRARWEAFENNRGRVVVIAPESAGENTVVQRLRTGDGATYEVRVTVEKAGGQWRITGAEPDLIPAR